MAKCTDCRLSEDCKNIRQMGTGLKSSKIMVVQDNPTISENRNNELMLGKTGRLFKAALGEVGIDIDDVYFTSLVKCCSPDDRPPLNDEIKACSDYLLSEIEVIKPKVIIPIDNSSLKFLIGITGITKQRGRIIEKDGHTYFPIVNPQLVLKQPKHMDNFVKDMSNLYGLLHGEVSEGIEEIDKKHKCFSDFTATTTEIKRFIDMPTGTVIAFDLETVKLDPFISEVTMSPTMRTKFPTSNIPKILAIGLSEVGGYGAAIPLFHRQTPFDAQQLQVIIGLLQDLFSREDIEFAGHNAKFDIKWLRYFFHIDAPGFMWDTMLMHYIAVTEEKGEHGLKELAWIYTDMGGYDDALETPTGEDKGNYDLIELPQLLEYLCGDADCTRRLVDIFKPMIMEDEQLKWIWFNMLLPGSNALTHVEENGAFVDQAWQDKLLRSYPIEIDRITEKLHQFPEVLEMEREKEDKWKERVSIGSIKKANRTEEQQDKFTKYKTFDPSKEGGTTFNFNSTKQLSELLFNRLGLTTNIETDKGNFSTNDESLEYMKGQHPICKTLGEVRKVTHLYNNFVLPLSVIKDSNSMVHSSYHVNGTVTGRLSSSDPNSQQYPRHSNSPLMFQYSNEIKSLFVSRFGEDGVLVNADYSQLEIRILAVFSQDKHLINLFKSGVDLHRATAAQSFNKRPEDITKDERTAAKKITFGIIYQESPEGLAHDLNGEGIDITVNDCKKFIDGYFKVNPGVAKWVRTVKRNAQRNKYVETLTGRKRHLAAIDSSERSIANMALRQAVNSPIQGTGSECTLESVIQMDKWMRETNKKSKMIMTVHDSIVLDCTKDEAIEVSEKLLHIMAHLAEYNPFFSFLGDVPIKAELEIGYDYAHTFETSISELETIGIDTFMLTQLEHKYDYEHKLYKDCEDKGILIPNFVDGYWRQVDHTVYIPV